MKKLILSAVFALACFSAQAKNEVIKNDDDKNPKNKVVARAKALKKLPCTRSRTAYVRCDGGGWAQGNASATAMNGNCQAADSAAGLMAEANAILLCNNGN